MRQGQRRGGGTRAHPCCVGVAAVVVTAITVKEALGVLKLRPQGAGNVAVAVATQTFWRSGWGVLAPANGDEHHSYCHRQQQLPHDPFSASPVRHDYIYSHQLASTHRAPRLVGPQVPSPTAQL